MEYKYLLLGLLFFIPLTNAIDPIHHFSFNNTWDDSIGGITTTQYNTPTFFNANGLYSDFYNLSSKYVASSLQRISSTAPIKLNPNGYSVAAIVNLSQMSGGSTYRIATSVGNSGLNFLYELGMFNYFGTKEWVFRIDTDAGIYDLNVHADLNYNNKTILLIGTINFTSNIMKLYVDGVQYNRTDVVGDYSAPVAMYFNTGKASGSSGYWDGLVDEIYLFNYTLSDSEINTVFETCGFYPNIFDELTEEKIIEPYLAVVDGNNSFSTIINKPEKFIRTSCGNEITLEYNKDNYFLRRYYTTFTSPLDYKNFTLYLLNSSSPNAQLTSYSVVDASGVPISNALIKLLKFYPANNLYKIVQMSKSDSNGEGVLSTILYDPLYKFIVERNGNVIEETLPSSLFRSSLQIQSDLSENVIQSLSATTNMQGVITYDNSTRLFTYGFNDPTGIVNEVCLVVTRTTARGITPINESCLTGSSAGIITAGIPENPFGLYRAYAAVETSTTFSPHLPAVKEVSYNNTDDVFRSAGIIVGILIILTFALIGAFVFNNVAAASALTVLGYIFSGILGLIPITWGSAIGLIILAGLITYLTRRGDSN